MAGPTPIWKQRNSWAIALGLASLAAWVVGLGAGLRGWILTDGDLGIVAHAQGFGEAASVWWVPASILTLTAAVVGIGTAIVRHMVDGPIAAAEPSVPELEAPAHPLRAAEDGAGGGADDESDRPARADDAEPRVPGSSA